MGGKNKNGATSKCGSTTPTQSADNDQISDSIKNLIAKTVQEEINSVTVNLQMAIDNNTNLVNKITALEKRLQLTEGLLHQAQTKIKMQSENIIDLHARSMHDNILISGIEESDKESWADTETKVVSFLKDELKIEDADASMLERVHRIGTKIPDKTRNVVVKFTSSAHKDKIFKNIKNLAGKKQYKIQEQLPGEIQERRKRLWPQYKQARDRAKLDRTTKVNWSLDKLYINGTLHTAADDVQSISPSEHYDSNARVEHSQLKTDKGSTFQGHAANLSQNTSAAAVLAKLLANPSVAKAEHNIYAFRTKIGDTIKEFYSDDGEHGAGQCLLRTLRDQDALDVMVVCTRWFGGTHIGPKRFDHITECIEEALQRLTRL